jgi:hypothetical protein
MREKPGQAAAAPVPTDVAVDVTPQAPKPARPKPTGARVLLSFVIVAGLVIALPVLVVIGSMPSGLISAFIIFIGIRQAWKMTQAPVIKVAGPYRIGVAQSAAQPTAQPAAS